MSISSCCYQYFKDIFNGTTLIHPDAIQSLFSVVGHLVSFWLLKVMLHNKNIFYVFIMKHYFIIMKPLLHFSRQIFRNGIIIAKDKLLWLLVDNCQIMICFPYRNRTIFLAPKFFLMFWRLKNTTRRSALCNERK